MFIDDVRSLLVACLFIGFSAGQQQQQCSNTKKTHLSLARLQEPARVLYSQFPIVSADHCYDMCCQFNSDDGSQCNAAVFLPNSNATDDDAGGRCTLLDCRPTFGNCVWIWSPFAGSSVARVVHIEQAMGTQQQEPLTPVQLLQVQSAMSDDIVTTTDSSRNDELLAGSTPSSSLAPVLEIPTTSTTVVSPTGGGNDDSSYYEDFDYDDDPSRERVDQQQTTSQNQVSTVTAAISEHADDAVWNLDSSNFDDNVDEHQNQAVNSTSSLSSAVLPMSSQPVADALDEFLIEISDKDDRSNNVVDHDEDPTHTDIDNRPLISSPSSSPKNPINDKTEPFYRDSNDDDDEWKSEFIKSRSKTHWKERIGSASYDDINDEAGSSNGDTSSIKMTAFLLPSSESSDRHGLQASIAILATMSLVTIICLLFIIVGCRRACSSRPRYIALRDDTGSTSYDFPTNYLVAQPSSGPYRASLLAK